MSAGDVGRYWDSSHASDAAADELLEHPIVQGYVSLRAFGSTRGHMAVAIEEIERRTSPGARMLSVGCGGAGKERAICRALPDRTLLGMDIATETLARMRSEIAEHGPANLELAYGDFNALDLEPNSYDVILGLGAIHHVNALEQFWQQCRRALRPGGVIIAQEYVGPSRFQWTDTQLERANEALREIVPPDQQGDEPVVVRVSADEVAAIDPSEAVRSDEILATCRDSGLEITDYRGAGCGLIQPVLMDRVQRFDPRNWQHNHVLFELFAREDRLIREGAVGDHYAMFVCG